MVVTKEGRVIGAYGKEIGVKDNKGYVIIRLGKHDSSIKRCVLVAKEYLDWFDGCEVHHRNGITDDDRVENLECLTPFQHRLRHNRIKIVGRINKGTIDRVYNSISDAELDNNLPRNHSHINEVILGVQEKCGGYGWVGLEYSEFIHYFVRQTQESVSFEEQVQAYALIYNALLVNVRVRLPLLSKAETEETSLLSIFKGFHF